MRDDSRNIFSIRDLVRVLLYKQDDAQSLLRAASASYFPYMIKGRSLPDGYTNKYYNKCKSTEIKKLDY